MLRILGAAHHQLDRPTTSLTLEAGQLLDTGSHESEMRIAEDMAQEVDDILGYMDWRVEKAHIAAQQITNQ